MGPICCPETSVRNYHYSLRNSPEERSSPMVTVHFPIFTGFNTYNNHKIDIGWLFPGGKVAVVWSWQVISLKCQESVELYPHSTMCRHSVHEDNFTCLMSAIWIPHQTRRHSAQNACQGPEHSTVARKYRDWYRANGSSEWWGEPTSKKRRLSGRGQENVLLLLL
jgi:hypothetical protein